MGRGNYYRHHNFPYPLRDNWPPPKVEEAGSTESVETGGDYPSASPPTTALITKDGHVVLSPAVMEQLERIEDKLDRLLGEDRTLPHPLSPMV